MVAHSVDPLKADARRIKRIIAANVERNTLKEPWMGSGGRNSTKIFLDVMC